jgi:uncharacterized membrane protein HdeD (DUF308 family)
MATTDRQGEALERSDGGALVGAVLEGRLQRTWWAAAFRGLVAILIGIIAMSWTQLTLTVLLVLLGTYFILDGIFALIAGFHASDQGRSWWPYLLEGLLSLVVGVLAFIHPATVALFVLLLVAFRCVVTGFVTIASAIWLHRETGNSAWPLWLAGLVSIGFGVVLLARPGLAVASLVWVVGFYTIVFGIVEIVTAFRMRGAVARLTHRVA